MRICTRAASWNTYQGLRQAPPQRGRAPQALKASETSNALVASFRSPNRTHEILATICKCSNATRIINHYAGVYYIAHESSDLGKRDRKFWRTSLRRGGLLFIYPKLPPPKTQSYTRIFLSRANDSDLFICMFAVLICEQANANRK